MVRFSCSRAALLAALSTVAGLCANGAWAQTARPGPAVAAPQDSAQTPETSQVDDIVVTALRRSERLQEAPAAITALTAETLASAGVQDLDDVSRIVPALRFEGGIRPGVPSIAVRGISAVQGGDAPVSILIDGVQVPFLSLARMDLLDVSSIEILRGPQGALYGRGAIAGALLINTRQPDDEFRAAARLTAQEGHDYKGTVTVSGPIIPGLLAAKLTESYQSRDGLLKYFNRGDYADFVDQNVVSGTLLLTPREGTRAALTGSYTHGTVGTNGLSLVPVAVPNALEDFDSYTIQHNFRNYDQRRLSNIALKVDQDLPFGTLTVVAQYARARDYVVNDFDYTNVAARINYNPELDAASVIDARISSKPGGTFSWIVGAFYQNRIGENFVNVRSDPAVAVPAAPILNYQRNTSKSWAGYGQGRLELPHGVTLIGALRYDEDKRYDVLLNLPGSDANGTFSAWQPSFTAKWQIQHDLMAYATYGRGFRSGGFNAANLTAVGASRIYDKEISDNYELGVKSQLFDGMLTLNADVFRTNYDNTQYQRTILSPAFARYITSIPESRVNGAELEATYLATSDLTLAASVALTDTEIEDFNGTTLYVGNPLPNAYHDVEQVSVDWHPQLTDTLKGLVRIDASRRGRISYDLPNAANYKPVTYLNARVGVETDQWSLAVFGENLTDTRAPEFVFPNFQASLHGRLANQPLHVGVELNYKFGG